MGGVSCWSIGCSQAASQRLPCGRASAQVPKQHASLALVHGNVGSCTVHTAHRWSSCSWLCCEGLLLIFIWTYVRMHARLMFVCLPALHDTARSSTAAASTDLHPCLCNMTSRGDLHWRVTSRVVWLGVWARGSPHRPYQPHVAATASWQFRTGGVAGCVRWCASISCSCRCCCHSMRANQMG